MRFAAICLFGTFMVIGCRGGDGPERVVVAGRVTYQGQPLPEGQIRFIPIEGTKAPISAASISDGEYSIDSRGGVPVGTHKIEIIAHRIDRRYAGSTGASSEDVDTAPPRLQYLPKKYNAETELQMLIEPGNRKITKDFDLSD